VKIPMKSDVVYFAITRAASIPRLGRFCTAVIDSYSSMGVSDIQDWACFGELRQDGVQMTPSCRSSRRSDRFCDALLDSFDLSSITLWYAINVEGETM